MEIEQKIKLITRPPVEEVITLQELRTLLEAKKNPIAYDGFEPSGFAHIASGLMRAQKISDLIEAGVRFKLLIADWHAWINEKMGGNLEKIKNVGKYMVKVWESLGVDTTKVQVLWASDLIKESKYWEKVVLVMKNTTIPRIKRAITIMGRSENELQSAGQFLYPAMQVADIFHMGVDICQLGIDQRKANILAREIGEKMGWYKPIVISHHMLMGLKGPVKMGGYDDKKEIDLEISSKMSKSLPDTAIFVHDSPELITEKLQKAYCPEKEIKLNPVIDIVKNIILRDQEKEYVIERPKKFGGEIVFTNFKELQDSYRKGDLHPMDLKKSVAKTLVEMLEPARKYFEKNPKYVESFTENDITR
jgi:tyrosyl-tRNA synthetase